MSKGIRELQTVTEGRAVLEGDGVKVQRMIGGPELALLDPFLLFDVLAPGQPHAAIGGFPDHPHRGFETVTYLLAGRLRHKDNSGHEGLINAGEAQWMNAGRGIVHAETPEEEDGRFHGFQLWINLPASQRMRRPSYREFSTKEIIEQPLGQKGRLRIIAGESGQGNKGPLLSPYVQPTYMDVSLAPKQQFEQPLQDSDNAFIYLITGKLWVGQREQVLSERQLGVLGSGTRLRVRAELKSRFLLVAGQQLREQVVRGGPFVMNTKAELLQAFDDFKNNRF